MHDRNTLQSRYTSLSFWSRPNYVGPQCAAPAPSRAISSAFKCDTQTFTPAPASIGIPVLRRDPQRPHCLIRPHHSCAEPSRLCGLIATSRYQHFGLPNSPALQEYPQAFRTSFFSMAASFAHSRHVGRLAFSSRAWNASRPEPGSRCASAWTLARQSLAARCPSWKNPSE